ncbi:MAG: PEP-CTERM sorting domain-containing protein [Planctomycetota bacterium]
MLRISRFATCAGATALSAALLAPGAHANLLTNPSFEDGLNGWSAFNNVFPTSDSPRSGTEGVLLLGPFFNLPNASGLFQDVPVSPGDIVEGSMWFINDTSITNGAGDPDIIAGTGNVVDLAIEWIDGGGNNLGQAALVQVFDGQDPNLPLDVFVQGVVTTGPAPAGAASARLVALFVQPPTFDGGLVFADDASVTIVPEPATAALLGLGGLVALRRRRA